MTNGTPPKFNHQLHTQFVDRLEALEPSNLFEQVFVDVARDIGHEEKGETATQSLRPYVDGCARAFQSDLRRWLQDEYDSPSNWLQSTRDLFCFHFMMYYVQLALNLEQEFSRLHEDPEQTSDPEVKPVYFGMWDEKASMDRPLSREWRERDNRGVEGHLYDSWGRLAVLNIISEVVKEHGPDDRSVVTLSEAMQLPVGTRRRCVKEIQSHIAATEDSMGMDLPSAAVAMTRKVRDHYESKNRSNQTPITMGINVIRQLGDGGDRKYWRTQRKVGPTFRFNRGALRFFARLFAMTDDDTHYDEFVRYLQRRGVFLDSQSETAALEELDEMGMIDRQSDSGDSVYVRSV